MHTHVADTQTVSSSSSTLFSMLQSSPVSALVILNNTGTNVISYDFQQLIAGVWTDIQAFGNPLNNTLSPGQQVTLLVTSSYPQVQLIGNASGGSVLDFSVTRFFNRISGGQIPLLSY